jgi:hypothetical protein
MRGRKRSASEESRRLKTEERRERKRVRDARRREAETRAAAMRAALARRPESSAQAVDRLVAGTPDDPRLRELLQVVADRAPRMLDADMLGAIRLVARAGWVRPTATWRADGKSTARLFRSLAEHLLARYRVPAFVWNAFVAGDDAPILAPVVVHVAAGGSLYDAVKSGLMPVPLTRAMCHALLSSGGEASFLDAVRKVQVQAAGGDGRLFRAWTATAAGRRLHARADEVFWGTVLAWFCANPMLPFSEVGPLVDYIAHRRAQSPGFSMKGRGALALLRGMREWHGELAKARDVAGRVFAPSGFAPMDLDRSRRDALGNTRAVEVWHVREILDARTLADEGRAMGHCVYSYARAIETGLCAIWTLTLRNDTGHWRRLTIEVRPSLRQIVQARGRFNARAEPRDLLALEAWATRNRLTLSLGRW